MGAYGSFEKSVQKSMNWLGELAEKDGVQNKEEAYVILRAVLQTLRDRLTVEECAHFASQLPSAIRGVYYDGWKPTQVPVKYNLSEFMQAVRERCANIDGDLDEEAVISSVFDLLQRHVSEGEIEDIKGMLPKSFDALWPDQKAA